MNSREKRWVVFFVVLAITAFALWAIVFYLNHTHPAPRHGGEYIEGAIGQPLYINPVLSQPDGIDGDLVQLIFGSLVSYDTAGNIIPDLAERWEISEDQKEYTFYLRDNLFWHDGTPLTARDVQYTFNLIKDPTYKSPLRRNLLKVNISVLDERAIRFSLEEPLAPFVHNLNFGILPSHLWESVAAEKFPLSDYNINPIGSGPYKFNDFQKDAKGNIRFYKLVANPKYHFGKPYISKITFNFYPDEETALEAFNKKEIMGVSSLAPEKILSIKNQRSTDIHEISIPRYFAVFFNINKSVPLSYEEVRHALSRATSREEIIAEVFNSKALALHSPLLPGMLGFADEINKREFDLEEANRILEEAGWTLQEGIRKKDTTGLTINLLTTDWPDLSQTAAILKTQWEKVGARVNVEVLTTSDVNQNHIKPREYEALLLGHRLSADPDLYSLWHSSQRNDPGQNLSAFSNNDADVLLEEARRESNAEVRAQKYAEFQKILAEEMPAVFLYSPYYLYPVNKKVRSIGATYIPSSSRRFTDVNQWYLKTKRVWN